MKKETFASVMSETGDLSLVVIVIIFSTIAIPLIAAIIMPEKKEENPFHLKKTWSETIGGLSVFDRIIIIMMILYGLYFIFLKTYIILVIVVAIVYYSTSILQKILGFFLSFLPEKVNINGEIVDTYVEPGFYPFFASIDNLAISFKGSKGVPIDFYYIKIWDPLLDKISIVSVDSFMYDDMKIRLDNLDLMISISCKKDLLSGELYL